ncbi:MAG TPA: MFS transporter [Solirubrobacteraceae bacterium]
MTAGSPSSQRALVPLYLASIVLTLGEGSVAILIPPYLQTRGFDAGVIGVVLSAYGIASLATRVPAGLLYRSHRGPWLVAGGCLMSAAAFAAIPLTASPPAIIGLVALDGIGFSLSTTGAMAGLMERRPPGANAGSVMGWYTGSLGAGYAAAGFVGGTLGELAGVDQAILVLAAVPVLASGLLKLALDRAGPVAGAPPGASGARARWRDLRGLPALVWLAFLVSLYINLVNGVLFTFFPIYGLAIGLSLAQIGALTGIHGVTASAVRLGSGLVFARISYERLLPLMVVLSGTAIAGLSATSTFVLLAVCWAVIGLSRGLLRVASGALVMDMAGGSDSERGAASGVYLAGLDLGKIVGPLVGGASAELVGLRATFLLVALAFPLAYLAVTATAARRARAAGASATS